MPRVLTHAAVQLKKKKKKYGLGFPGSSVIKNPPSNAGDESLTPEQATEQPTCVSQLMSLCSRAQELQLEGQPPRASAPLEEKPLQ